jgi:acyl-[acyl-carrier-protein]-phospholipid O-acyltransferase/long-chain-fatty-acid--[acyl-carrier-protein] ligase
LTFTLWLPLVSGFSASYHPNPLDAAGLSGMIKDEGCTILFGTPTFLTLYLRRFKKEDIATLRVVLVGAEKLNPKLARNFEDRFGAMVLEGYGATELSPLATVSLPHREEDGMLQAGWKEGSVGPAMPGVAIKVVDLDSGEDLAQGEEGLMMVKGPNVMLGYLGQPVKTADALQEGWYNTGDMARLDEEGFVFITDRLSRFSKIGGEMVPHLRIEQELLKGKAPMMPSLAVTSIPDEKRGERLVVLYTEAAGCAESLHETMQQSEVPNLWKPDLKCYFQVEEIPVLGTGKIDLKGLKDMAQQKVEGV